MDAKSGQRTNKQWMSDLRHDPADARAVDELHNVLRRALQKSLAGRGDVREADFEDFTQDSIIRVLSRLESFRGDSKFTTWAIAVAIRVAHTRLRERCWGARSLEDLGLTGDAIAVAGSPADSGATGVEYDELLVALRRAIDRDLTPKQRSAVLAELAGMPTTLVAEQLGTNTNALYKLHHDARRKLLATLEREGFSIDGVRSGLARASKR